MESKHIKAMKEPWRQSNHWNALGHEPEDEDEEDEDDKGDIDGPAVKSCVNLAKTVCKLDIFYKCITTADNGLQ